MKNNNHHTHDEKAYTLRDFAPLIIIMTIIIIAVIIKAWITHSWTLNSLMQDFMAAFFLVFGTFKILNLEAFATAYATYDIPSQYNRSYAYAYPFIELMLGFLYLVRWAPLFTNLFTFIIMSISALGVFKELQKKRTIPCACLGVVFKIPMTYVTLFEDLLMAFMALIMLFR